MPRESELLKNFIDGITDTEANRAAIVKVFSRLVDAEHYEENDAVLNELSYQLGYSKAELLTRNVMNAHHNR